jgi:hypothetical protein
VFTFAHPAQGGYNAAMPRRLEWIESQTFQGFGCSECDWKHKPSAGAPTGTTLDEMKAKYEAERDKEFAAHICLKRPKAPDQNANQ